MLQIYAEAKLQKIVHKSSLAEQSNIWDDSLICLNFINMLEMNVTATVGAMKLGYRIISAAIKALVFMMEQGVISNATMPK